MSEDNELDSLRQLVQQQLANPGSLNADKLIGSGISDANSLTKEQFIEKCPFTTKSEIVTDHQHNPPFGSNLCQDLHLYSKLSKTSGTSGEPISWLDTSHDWSNMLDAWDFIYSAADLKIGTDVIYFAFSFGPFLGFWTAYEAASRKGYLTVPGGGLSSESRIDSINDCGATVLCCTPTYAMRLGEVNSDTSETSINKIIVAGEPGGSIPSIRKRISDLWSGAEVIDHHGMTEVGPVTFQSSSDPCTLSVIPGYHLSEVIDIESGKEVGTGEEGELVLTTLKRSDNALLRYRTGDLVKKSVTMVNGQELLSFEGGVLGRIDDMVVIRGVNIYPSAIDSVISEYVDISEYRVVVRDERSMKEIQVLVNIRTNSEDDELILKIEDKLKSVFSLRIPVKNVKNEELERFEFKARRWITE